MSGFAGTAVTPGGSWVWALPRVRTCDLHTTHTRPPQSPHKDPPTLDAKTRKPRALLLKIFITSAVTLDAPVPPTTPSPSRPPQPAVAAAAAAAAATEAGGAASISGDPCEHLGAVITNVTRLKKGREMLLEPGRGLLQALASQLAPGSSEGRRRGCSGALRNCCLSAEVGRCGYL